ncbi:MAG: 3-deoxy-manno-octulosonate cytidylyltransferase [Pseudomonadota bacterium]
MTQALVIIPARMAASRLPGKPLADIAGKPMVVRVAERAEAASVGPVAVATDSSEIVAAVEAEGMRAVLTSTDHPSGSDRVFEAAEQIDPDKACDLIINVQGDFPTIAPAIIAQTAALLDDADVDLGTAAAAIHDARERHDRNVVKAVLAGADNQSTRRALYFTRSTAPSGPGPLYHHVGIYAWRRDALRRFISLPQSTLEKREKLEQLRAIEAGMTVAVAVVDSVPLGVDTPALLERVRTRFTG